MEYVDTSDRRIYNILKYAASCGYQSECVLKFAEKNLKRNPKFKRRWIYNHNKMSYQYIEIGDNAIALLKEIDLEVSENRSNDVPNWIPITWVIRKNLGII
jgi:hypothetical protein